MSRESVRLQQRARRRVRVGRVAAIRLLVCTLVLIAFALISPSVVVAEDSPARKLGRGAANLSLGVLAIPDVIIETSRERGPAIGVTWGLVKGTGVMLATEVVGLFEIMTCPFATPPDYRQILDPEFPWQRFTNEGDRKASARRGRIAIEGGR